MIEVRPRSNLTLPLDAGSQALLVVHLVNDDENPAAYVPRLTGSAAQWASSAEPEIVLLGGARGSAKIDVRVPTNTDGGRYHLEVQIDANGVPDDTLGTMTVTLEVAGSQPPPQAAQKEPPPSEQKVSGRDDPPPAPEAPQRTQPTPETPAQNETKKPEKSTEAKAPKTTSEAPSDPQQSAKPQVGETTKTAPEEKTSAVAREKATPPKKSEPPRETPIIHTKKSEESSAPPSSSSAEENPPKGKEPQYTRELIDPSSDAVVAVRSGDSIRVVLNFVSGPNGGRYVLEVKDDGHPELDAPFVTLLRQAVDPAPEKPDYLEFRIDVPIDAPPQDHKLRIVRGLAMNAEQSVLKLRVQPTVEVRTEIETPRVVVGPVRSFADFKIDVVNAGNVGTACRLSARRPSETGRVEEIAEREDIASDGPWRYLFDTELQNVPGSRGGRISHRFRVAWYGIWWLGWFKRQKVAVVATPVTDASNHGSLRNVTLLEAVRWRLLPLPWFLAVPLLLLVFGFFFTATASISDLTVTNAVDNGTYYYVLQTRPDGWHTPDQQEDVILEAKLKWNARTSWVRVTPSQENAKHKPEISQIRDNGVTARLNLERDYDDDRLSVDVASIFGTGGDHLRRNVRFVTARTKDMLHLVPVGIRGSAKELPRTKEGWTQIEIDLQVNPDSTVKIVPKNASTANQIKLYLFKKPAKYNVEGLGLSEARDVRPGGEGTPITLRPTEALGPEGDSLEIVTTDAAFQLIKIKLVPQTASDEENRP